jgi:hypothetical protein
MQQETERIFNRQGAMKKCIQFPIAAFLILVVLHMPAARAQQRNNNTPKISDLAMQNLSRVAASASEVKSVLVKDPGLMVELKRWVAKDATDHGQIISDSDLTDDAIFEKLESDVSFRAVATQLVQRYGYLLPKVNPDSEAGKERELILQDRAKWLAQRQEEELSQARQARTRNQQNNISCDVQDNQQVDYECNDQQMRPSSSTGTAALQKCSPGITALQPKSGWKWLNARAARAKR